MAKGFEDMSVDWGAAMQVAPKLRAWLSDGATMGRLGLVKESDACGEGTLELSASPCRKEIEDYKAKHGRLPETVRLAGKFAFRLEPLKGCGRLGGKVAVVTGAAQGFGLGIAEGLAGEGACVCVADLNLEGALNAASWLEAKYGAGMAFGVAVDVSDESSVQDMVKSVVGRCGGVDVFIANAGVLKAGSVKTMSRRDWDFVTDVNYVGYFLCVKHVSPVMSAQNAEGGGWTDIVQINSKSGLAGSMCNGAYSGSKFGGIGLTQSFALELVADMVKVNSICPGNYFEGPLWCDPEKGLFVQYLRSGKVAGAKSIEDVKRLYEAKVPMKRGCLPQDVVKAILYAVEQEYETGQAIPVSGGQVMLS